MPSSGPRAGVSEGMKLTGARASAVPCPGIGHESTSSSQPWLMPSSDRCTHERYTNGMRRRLTGAPQSATAMRRTYSLVRDESVVNDSVRNWRSERLDRGRQDAARVGGGTRRSGVVDEYRGFSDHGPGVLSGDIRARPHRARRTGQRPVNDYSL